MIRNGRRSRLDLGASDILYAPVDTQELAIRIRAQLGRKRQADRLRASLRAGLELAVTDSLTGLHNRRYGLYRLEQMMARPGKGIVVMMLDLDHFKGINDRHGHAAGDEVLRRLSRRPARRAAFGAIWWPVWVARSFSWRWPMPITRPPWSAPNACAAPSRTCRSRLGRAARRSP